MHRTIEDLSELQQKAKSLGISLHKKLMVPIENPVSKERLATFLSLPQFVEIKQVTYSSGLSGLVCVTQEEKTQEELKEDLRIESFLKAPQVLEAKLARHHFTFSPVTKTLSQDELNEMLRW